MTLESNLTAAFQAVGADMKTKANAAALNASALTSGIVPVARLGTGTADAGTYLAGDRTWKTMPTGTSGGLAAAPNGTDDTATIRTAMANKLRLQPGTYAYKGTGEDLTFPWLVGAGAQQTTVTIPAGVYLIDSNQVWEATRVEGVFFSGGAGAIRNRYTGSNVSGWHNVRDCRFQDYTQAAISHNSSDMPYWNVDSCIFWGANETSTVGVALSGLTDRSVIRSCAFLNYAVGIKLAAGFANTTISDCDMVHFTATPGTPRVNVWLVPKGTDWQGNVDAGSGTVIRANKFGAENISTSDFRIWIGGELSGATNAQRLPDFSTVVGGYVNGIRVEDNNIGGNSNGAPPLVHSMTPNFVSSRVLANQVSGTMPTYLVTYASGAMPTSHTDVSIGDITRQWAGVAAGTNDQSLLATNAPVGWFDVRTRNTSSPNQLIPNYA